MNDKEKIRWRKIDEHRSDVAPCPALKRGEQYGGWKQLPAAGREMAGMSRDAAAEILERYSDVSAAAIAQLSASRETAYKQAIVRTHPDKPGSSDGAFIEVQRAVEVLRTLEV